jgi:hypothetical protein
MIKHVLPPEDEREPGPPNVPETIVAIVFVAIVWGVAVLLGHWALP